MKKNAMKAIFCYILCLALVAVYSSFHVPNPDFDLTDFAPEFEEFDYDHSYAELNSDCLINGWFAANAEGQRLRRIYRNEALDSLFNRYTAWEEDWRIDYDTYRSLRNKLYKALYGDMQCNESAFMGGPSFLRVPFSKTFAMPAIPLRRRLPASQEAEMTPSQKAEWEKTLYPSYSSVLFHFGDTDETLREGVNGFTGTIVFHSDNAVELFGDVKDVEVSFRRISKDYLQDIKWTACGSGGFYAKFTFTGDGIIAEGLPGGYTVTKYDRIKYMELFTKAYDETGKEIPYVPPEDEATEE